MMGVLSRMSRGLNMRLLCRKWFRGARNAVSEASDP
jgi:hypothetical protein